MNRPSDAASVSPGEGTAGGGAAAQLRGVNGMPKLSLAHPSGATAELYLNGAHLTSWRTADGDETLFLSERSRFAPGTAIRGGIPIVFPQFGPGPLPQHGFARVQEWTLADSGSNGEQAVFATLRLTDNDATRALWPHAFLTEVTVSLTPALEVSLAVTNTGDEPFSFTAALHSYFRIADVREVRIEGLNGIRYRDKVRDGIVVVDDAEAVTIRGETDRVYLDGPSVVRIRDGRSNRTVRVHKDGFADVVVWNPWLEKARELQDFGDDEYLNMVCVEAAQVGEPVRLEAGECWRGGQTLTVTTEDAGIPRELGHG